jgi:hypothetical protein
MVRELFGIIYQRGYGYKITLIGLIFRRTVIEGSSFFYIGPV